MIYAYDKSEVKSSCDDFIAAFDNSDLYIVGNAYVHSTEGVNVERSELHDVFGTKLESYSDVNYKREFVSEPVDSEHRVSQKLVIEKHVAMQRDKEFYQDRSLDINNRASIVAQFAKAVTFNRFQSQRDENFDERIQITASRDGQIHISPKPTAVNYQLARDFVSATSSDEEVLAKVSTLHIEALEKNTAREHSEVAETKTQSAKSSEETHKSTTRVEQQKNRKQHTR
ncbi:hypothetical protein B9G54_04500 [Alloscardovia macacae]|uniref:Uncharacterized protein n=1 Tax=Alloscardovia macacae TaxID=1160091 RepID=A0A1Y2T390_9BIFI|nr:hypothetical protein B9G54_04500 [Alloscardovia macacae]OTA29865.1 hypothetical protein B9T39_01945 [Alloscardovia macacae]